MYSTGGHHDANCHAPEILHHDHLYRTLSGYRRIVDVQVLYNGEFNDAYGAFNSAQLKAGAGAIYPQDPNMNLITDARVSIGVLHYKLEVIADIVRSIANQR